MSLRQQTEDSRREPADQRAPNLRSQPQFFSPMKLRSAGLALGFVVSLTALAAAGCGTSQGATATSSTTIGSAQSSTPTSSPVSSPTVPPTPAHGHFGPTGSMVVSLSDPTATVLADGKVLVTGADTAGRAELYDPATAAFSQTGAMVNRDAGNPGTLLQDGRVLIAGGTGSGASQIYDPVTGTFSATGSMVHDRWGDNAVLLKDGRVLIAGGYAIDGSGDPDPGATAEVYDPTTGRFTSTGSMANSRASAIASLLPDGRVLIFGGEHDPAERVFLATAEVYDPATGNFTRTGDLPVPLEGATATLLPNGRILVIGGQTGGASRRVSAASSVRPAP